MTRHALSAGIVKFDVLIENVVPDRSTGDDRNDKVGVIRHEDQHEEEREEHGGAVQSGSQHPQMCWYTDPVGIPNPPPIQQPHHLIRTGAPLRRAPATGTNGARCPLPLPECRDDTSVDRPLEDAEVLVQDAKEEDSNDRADKLGVGVDVPGPEDDAGVDDLGVPEHVHCTLGRHLVIAVVHGVVYIETSEDDPDSSTGTVQPGGSATVSTDG